VSTIASAIATGVAVFLAANIVWSGFGPIPGLAVANTRVWVQVPWAIVPTAVYLWVYWRSIGGAGRGPEDAAAWRADLRANPLSVGRWAQALAAGTLGIGALVALLGVVARVVSLPDGSPITTPPGMPFVTGFLLLVTQSVMAGVTEEAAFRGHMQSPIERRYGVAVAVLASGLVFGLLHFGSHPRAVVSMLPYYVAVSAVYGGLTWAVDSILPALVVHAVADIVVLSRWWMAAWQWRNAAFASFDRRAAITRP
jgi:membrane protease YdiL (CAAX protease family)